MRRSLLPAIAAVLRTGWRGTYKDLARIVASSPRAVGAAVRAYAARHPGWEHDHVVSVRTGRPANERPA
jgi:hypothetical protein